MENSHYCVIVNIALSHSLSGAQGCLERDPLLTYIPQKNQTPSVILD